MSKKVLIGGAWPYANSSLHLGHLAALISGDFLKRYHRILGDDVLYISGTDCHGTPITERALKEGISPDIIADKYHKEFKEVFEKMNFDYDIYTKTSDEYHKRKVQEIFLKIYDNGYIYPKKSLQPFCEKCNKFESDRELEIICPNCGNITKGDQCDCGYIPTEEDLVDAKCRICGSKTIQKENTHLYLALSKLQKQIEKYVEKNEKNWRIASKNETEKFLKEGLIDRAVTRDLPYGIEIPNKRMYVWVEAVLGYITATMKICEERNISWEDYWKESENLKMYMCHGKDNIPFHTMILPGLLLALDENYHLPDIMVASQYVNIDSEKISKSKGNGITILDMIKEYDVDSLRYYMIAYGPENADINFTMENYISVHNSDLVNKFGNFVNRTLNFKGLESIVPAKMNEEISKVISEKYIIIAKYIEKLEFRKACAEIIDLIEIGNKYYDERKPWIDYKENIEEFNNTIYTCMNVIANLSNMLEPLIPNKTEKLRKYLNIYNPTFKKVILKDKIILKNIELLFERIK